MKRLGFVQFLGLEDEISPPRLHNLMPHLDLKPLRWPSKILIAKFRMLSPSDDYDNHY